MTSAGKGTAHNFLTTSSRKVQSSLAPRLYKFAKIREVYDFSLSLIFIAPKSNRPWDFARHSGATHQFPMHTTQAYSPLHSASDFTNLSRSRTLADREHRSLALPCSWTKPGSGVVSNRQSSTMSPALLAQSYPTAARNEESTSEQEQKRHCMRRRKVSISTHHHSAPTRTGGRRWRLVLDHPRGKL